MAKLTKQEVNAIAGKLQRELSENARLERMRAVSEYIPSPIYLELESVLASRDADVKKKSELESRINESTSRIHSILKRIGSRKYPWDDCLLEEVVEAEVRLPKIPTIEELKDEITIAAIDSEFNVDSYINEQIEKYR